MSLIRKIVLTLSLVLLALTFASCGEFAETVGESLGADVEKKESASINEVHLRDKKLLYEAYDPLEVVTMYLTVSTGNAAENTDHTWEEINTYSAYYYDELGIDRYKVAGLLQVGDENGLVEGELGYGQVSSNCTIQIRGQTSSKNPQKNYKISIKDNKGSWRGQTTLALNKHMTDGMRFRNKIAYDLMADIDQMLGLRTTFVNLWVKDTTEGGSGEFEDYGIYTQVEQLNKTALKAHGLDKNGHLYKINSFEFYRYDDVIKLKTDPDFDEAAFEYMLETKGDDDHSKLIKMLKDVNDYAIPIDEVLDKYFDIENLSYWMAFQILVGNVDTQSRNCYIYSPLNSEKWYFYSWDNDAAFKRQEYEYQGRSDYSEWETGISNYWGNILFQRALKSERYRTALDNAINELREYMSAERISEMANAYAEVLKPYLYSMPDVMYMPLTLEEYDRILAAIPNEIEISYNYYVESLKKPQPFYIGVPRLEPDGLEFVWDNSYDFNSEKITYTFELARDYTFNDIIYKEENIKLPALKLDKLPEGQYFIRVRAKNESGYEQYAFDYYVLELGKVYGTKCFYIDSKGNVVEDVYVEG